ncbi:hypothetical protein UP09_20860 [Bradyrhizobium sp. LTSP885]|nr:hypothetical protein UP09_20860 [Bradyrhizobium sp. LTSP885]
MAANDRHTAAWKAAIARTTTQEEKASLLVDQRAWNKHLAVECEATGRLKPTPEQRPRMVRCVVNNIEDRIAFLDKYGKAKGVPNDASSAPQGPQSVQSLADLRLDVRIDGFGVDRVGEVIGATWRVREGALSKPDLTIKYEDRTNYDVQSGKTLTEKLKVIGDPSLAELGKRWSDDARLDMLVVSMPNTVRLEGDGFLTIPPGERAPFGIEADNDQLRVIFPLYLPESKTEGSLNIRPLKSGAFHLRAMLLTATSTGVLRRTDVLFDSTRELQDRSPAIVVQDRVSPSAPGEIWNSPNLQYQLRVFESHFEVLNAASGGLVLDLSGTNPRFSPTSRFLSYQEAGRLFVVDVFARKAVLAMSTRYDEGVDSLSFVRGDSYLVAGGTSYGKVGFWPTLVDGKIDQSFEDLIESPSVQNGEGVSGDTNVCHACITYPFEVLWSLDDGCLLMANPASLTEKRRNNIFSAGLQGFWITSILDHKIRMLRADKIGNPFFTRLRVPSDLGITYYSLWKSNEAQPEDIRVAQWIFAKDLTRMDKAASAGTISLPSLTAKPVLRELDFTRSEKSEERNSNKALVSVRKLGAKFDRDYPATESQTRKFPTEESNFGADNARGTKTRRPGFDQIVARLSSSVPAVHGTLTKPPRYYQNDYDSADFGYGLDFSYWLWKEDGGAYLITTEAYDSAGSSGVYTGRICIFRYVRSADDAAAHCSMADWNQNYDTNPKTAGKTFGEIERGVYGVGGAPQPMKAVRVGEEMFALLAPLDHIIALVGGRNLETVATIRDVPGAGSVQSLRLSMDGRVLLQLNTDGRLYLYSVAEQKRILSGVSIDGELVLYTDDGFYDGTPDGARYVYRYFSGLGEHHAFSQFASQFRRPELIQAILRGDNPPHPSADIVAPPSADFDLVPAGQVGRFTARVRVRSDIDLKTLRLFVDGAPLEELGLSGRSAEFERPIQIHEGTHWVTAVAYNALGFSSIPKSAVARGPAGAGSESKLFYVGIAVDKYPNFPDRNLKYANRDMRLIADTVAQHSSPQFGSIVTKELQDEQASNAAILATLEGVVSQTSAIDTLLVSFAGHGIRAGDRFYFLTSRTSQEDIPGTALLWDKVAEVLSRSKARVIVLLDACHSGAASQDAVVPNDDYAAALTRNGKAGMVVLAASKGREFSQEDDDLLGGHGLFSYAVARALGSDRKTADRNGNGVIELSELYAYVKRTVSEISSRIDPNLQQTPWLSRDEIIGEAPVM